MEFSTQKIHKPASNNSCLKCPRCCGCTQLVLPAARLPLLLYMFSLPADDGLTQVPVSAVATRSLPSSAGPSSYLLSFPKNQITQASRSRRPRHLLSVPGSPELQPVPQSRTVKDRMSRPSSRSSLTHERGTWHPTSDGERADGFQGPVRFFSVRSSFLGSEEYFRV